MSVDPKGVSFGRFCRLAMGEYLRQCGGRAKVSPQMTEEALEEIHTAWHAANDKPKAKRSRRAMTDEEWLAALHADPDYKGVNVAEELEACRRWCRKQEPPRVANRRTITNWMLNAVRKGPVADAPKIVKGPVLAEPKGWADFMRASFPDWSEFSDPRPLEWSRLPADIQRFVIGRMSKA